MRYPFFSRRRLRAAAVCLFILLTLCPAGCYRRVSYASPHGRRVEIVNFGFDTRIGTLSAETDDGALKIEDLDSSARTAAILAELAGQALRQSMPQGGGQ